VAGLRAGCLGHYVSNKQRKTERRKAILRFVIDARAHGRLTQAAVYALELREQTQVPFVLYLRRAKSKQQCAHLLSQWLLEDFRHSGSILIQMLTKPIREKISSNRYL